MYSVRMLEKRNKLKKFVVLGIVAMFASISAIVLQVRSLTQQGLKLKLPPHR